MDANERDKIGEMLSAYLDGELTGEQAADVEQLIADDAEARALLVELREAIDSVRQLPRAVAPSGILSEIQERVERQELLGPPDQPVTLSRHQRRPLRSILATAAALVITVGGGLWAISRLGAERGQQHVATTRDNGERELRRQLEDFPRGARERSSAPNGSLGETKESAESPVGGRLEGDQVRDTVQPQSVGQSKSAPAPISAMPADKDRETRTADESDLKLAMKRSPESTAGATVVEDQSSAADGNEISQLTPVKPQAEGLESKAGVQLRGRLKEGIDPRTATLEQKLAHELTVGDLLDHSFANEPLRLDVQVASAEQAPAVAERIRALVRSDDDGRLGIVVGTEFSEVREAPLDVHPGQVDDKGLSLSADRSLVMEGEPRHNFEPAARGEMQFLARVDAGTLARILDATRKEGDAGDGGAIVGRRFAVGRMDAESDEDVQQLAAMTLGDEFSNRRAGRGGRAYADARTVDTLKNGDEIATVDLAELLRGIGVGPPEVRDLGVRADESVLSRTQAPEDTERRFADASDELKADGADDIGNQGVSPQQAAPPNAPSQQSDDQQVASRRPASRELKSEESAFRKSDFTESTGEKAKMDGSETEKPVEVQIGKVDRLAKQRDLSSKSSLGEASSPPLYTIVIRLAPVAPRIDAAKSIESNPLPQEQPPVEAASPTPTASPSAAKSKPGASESIQPENNKTDSSTSAPVEMMEAAPTASPEPPKNE